MFRLLKMIFLCFHILSVFVVAKAFAGDLPEWDGVYLKDKNGEYVEMRKVINVDHPGGTNLYWTKDYNLIPANRFKGILIKGRDLISNVVFSTAERCRKSHLLDLFRKNKKIDYIKDCVEDPIGSNKLIYELRRRQIENAMYFEPKFEASQFFGTYEEGKMVQLIVGNREFYFFAIIAAKEDAKESKVNNDSPTE